MLFNKDASQHHIFKITIEDSNGDDLKDACEYAKKVTGLEYEIKYIESKLIGTNPIVWKNKYNILLFGTRKNIKQF